MNMHWVRWMLPSLILVGLASDADKIYGQSFLEKLESVVREQVKNSTGEESTSSTGELPPPSSSAERPTQNSPTPVKPQVTPPQPTPQTTSTFPSEPGQGSSSSTRVPQSGSGRVYLGLEAVNNSGPGIGVEVAAIANRSPAWKAGFKVGDRIVAINGFAISNLDDMVAQIAKTSPGQTARFLVSRDSRSISLNAVLMDADLAGQIAANSLPPSGEPFLGLTVNDLTNPFRRQFGISVFRGAAVSDVAASSPAQRAGIRPGDAVVEADGIPIESARSLIQWVQSTRPGQEVNLLVYRGGIGREVQLVIGSQGEPASNTMSGSSSTFRGNSAARPPIPSPNSQLDLNGRFELGANSPPRTSPEAGGALSLNDPSGTPPTTTVVPNDIPSNLQVPNPSSADSLSSILEMQGSQPQPEDFEPKEFEPSDIPASSQLGSQTGELQSELDQLRRQNQALTKELNATKEQLQRTEAKLEQILQLLKNQ